MSESLPIQRIREPFLEALGSGHVVIEAPTGSGKSTRLPLWCAEQGRTLVVEPRRIACRALARHLAASTGNRLGEDVGYAVRFENVYTPATDLVFATPGVALRWFTESELAGFGTIVIDEFHERRWDTDLLLVLLRAADRHRLVVTSATMEGDRLARYLDARNIRAEGRSYPVAVEYASATDLPRLHGLTDRTAAAVERALNETSEGDVLVFLPGRGEIRAVEAVVTDLGVEIIPLHAGTDTRIQDRALGLADHRRVILATNVAETSLTVPGVTVVVDSGLERRTHHRNGRTVLGLHEISTASAEQRAGRAGRVAPGRCLRLWGRQARLEAFTPPEVAREELTELVLAAAASGRPATGLRFPDPLPDHAVQRALQRLRAMAAIGDEGRITDHGKRLYPLPIDAMFAHLVTAMPDDASRAAMADLAAALTAGGALLKPARGPEDRAALQSWVGEPCDASTLIRLVRQDPPPPLAANRQALAEARRIADRIRGALALPPRNRDEPLDRAALLRAAIAAAPELAFVRRRKRRQALGNGDSEVEPAAGSHLPEEAEAAVVFDQHSTPGRGTNRTVNRGTCLAPVSLKWLAAAGLGEVVQGQPRWDGEHLTVEARRVYAGRTIHSETVEPTGSALRRAAAVLLLDGRLLPPAGGRLKEDTDAWNLYVQVTGEGEAVDPLGWAEERFLTLGVKRPEDLQLIEPEDLRFEGVPEWERARFEERYPRRVELSNLSMTAVYEPGRRRVTLERAGGKRRKPPTLGELPAWTGWAVRYRDGSRVITLK